MVDHRRPTRETCGFQHLVPQCSNREPSMQYLDQKSSNHDTSLSYRLKTQTVSAGMLLMLQKTDHWRTLWHTIDMSLRYRKRLCSRPRTTWRTSHREGSCIGSFQPSYSMGDSKTEVCIIPLKISLWTTKFTAIVSREFIYILWAIIVLHICTAITQIRNPHISDFQLPCWMHHNKYADCLKYRYYSRKS